MITIHYFASVREALARETDEMSLPADVESVADLVTHLSRTDPAFASLDNDSRRLLVAVNQTVVDRQHRLSANDEVAFFPPMTGG